MKKNLLKIFLIVFIINFGCQKFVEDGPLKIGFYVGLTNVDSLVNTTDSTIQLNIKFSDLGNGELIEKGVCFSIKENPTLDSNKIVLNNTNLVYSVLINNVKPKTNYYIRSYIINKAGINYSPQIIVQTKEKYIAPITSIHIDTNTILYNSLMAKYFILNKGNIPIIKSGICYGIQSLPNFKDSVVYNRSNNDTIILSLINLMPSTRYFIRSFIINLIDTIFSDEIVITTKTKPIILLPQIEVIRISDITSSSFTTQCNIINFNNVPIIKRGICYFKNNMVNKYFLFSNIINNTFSINTINLDANSSYMVKGIIITNMDTIYSNIYSIYTLPNYSLPTVQFDSITNIGINLANLYATIKDNGNLPITEKGFCWSKTTQIPTKENSNFQNIISNYNSFQFLLNNLDTNTNYYVRSYAINSVGINYSNVIAFKTKQLIDEILFTSAQFTSNGEINNWSINIIKTANGKYRVDFFNFNCVSGPDLNVFISPVSGPTNNSINIGRLKSTNGVQSYDLNFVPDFNSFKYVYIHCVTYNHFWGFNKFKN